MIGNHGRLSAYIRGCKSAAALLLAVILMASVSGCQDSPSNAQAPPPEQPSVKIDVEEVKPRLVRDVMMLPGHTVAVSDVVLAAETEGQVHWVGVTEGQPVESGQVIAKIDVESRKAALERSQAAHALAKSKARRRRQLHAKKAVPQEELDSSLTELQLAEGNLKQAEIAYKQGKVRSPINGVVNKVHVDPGEYIKTGEPVADIVDVSRIRVKCFVPEMDVRYLRPGQNALVRVDALSEENWIGTIEFVSFKADPATKTFEVWVQVDNSSGIIRPGMIARTAFVRREITAAITAPLTALVDKGGERILFIEKDGKAKVCQVTLGVIDGERIQILKGLNPGDRLIVVGQNEVEEGMKVVSQ
jgi:membrane fusion protein (multidrug efflux system)